MRVELHEKLPARGYAELLLYLGKMPVLGHTVAPGALVALAVGVEQISLLAAAAYAAVGVYHDMLRREQPRAVKRSQGYLYARRIAASAGYELVAPLRREYLGNDVSAHAQKLRRGVVRLVKLLVALKRTEAEVRRKVYHSLSGGDELLGVFRGNSVGKRQKPCVYIGVFRLGLGIRRGKFKIRPEQMRKPWHGVHNRLPGQRARRNLRQFHHGMGA